MTSPAPQPADGKREYCNVCTWSRPLDPDGICVRPTTPASACAHRWEPDATGVGVICMNCGSDEPAPASAEPTEGEWEAARQAYLPGMTADQWARATGYTAQYVHRIARALASQRAEIVARYEQKWAAAVCEAYIVGNGNGSNGLYDPEQIKPIIARIREAAPK